MADRTSAINAILNAIESLAEEDGGGKSHEILRLAEAHAWLVSPGHPHGGLVEGHA